ncbi:hypothetical protein IF1G_10088 [Cordyceps javanica]|uniref:Uncharacterized protein n=1 Tax=Cordyceps javanica TaxID=43265 RepID=A0A545UP19_9HYPO|nr:hypothetical protein IF1G_10088 [Cordyceps javanica]
MRLFRNLFEYNPDPGPIGFGQDPPHFSRLNQFDVAALVQRIHISSCQSRRLQLPGPQKQEAETLTLAPGNSFCLEILPYKTIVR